MQLALPRSLGRHWFASQSLGKHWPDDRWHEIALARLLLESFLILSVTTLAVYLYSAAVAGA